MKFDHKEAFALGLFGSGSLLGDGVGNCKLVSVSEPFSWHCSWASSSWRIYSWLQSIHWYVVCENPDSEMTENAATIVQHPG